MQPYWLTAKFDSNCAACDRKICRGERIYYFPEYRMVNCRQCGERKYYARKAEQKRKSEQSIESILI